MNAKAVMIARAIGLTVIGFMLTSAPGDVLAAGEPYSIPHDVR